MKRIGRYLLNAALALSLIVCVAVAGLWVRSYMVSDHATWNRERYRDFFSVSETYTFHSVRGDLGVEYEMSRIGSYYTLPRDPWPAKSTSSVEWDLGEPRNPTELRWVMGGVSPGRFGVGWKRRVWKLYKNDVREQAVVLAPYRVVLAGCGGFPGMWGVIKLARLVRARRRERRGLCTQCGYDLRTTPDRCPECGEVRKGCSERSGSRIVSGT